MLHGTVLKQKKEANELADTLCGLAGPILSLERDHSRQQAMVVDESRRIRLRAAHHCVWDLSVQ